MTLSTHYYDQLTPGKHSQQALHDLWTHTLSGKDEERSGVDDSR